ncbi:neural/ectodermal development factor IMP-L2 [Diachasma alloeum]|uniref:neural/ectodermal development factor IMP-L2 n=1 Tax=Diachasma alloeum TaxID=454923 RepID=UPI0007384785|nr:neural/ectodermal development factor IMP-L2 [Diachasma alloeum]
MQRSLLGFLVGFSTITILLQVVAGSSLGFLRALAQEEAEDEQQQQLAFDDVEQTNMISDYPIKYTPTHKQSKEWVKVELSGSLHSRVLSKGQYYELTCKGEGGPAPQIYWIRGGNIQRQLDELKKTSLAYDPSVFVNAGAAKKESKYVIDCASKQDEGPIHCVAIAGDKVKWESTNILVPDNVNSTRSGSCGSFRPPVITHHAATVVAFQDTSVILPCIATGKPRPYITWETSDGSLITNHLFNPRYKVLSTGNLLINALEWDDMNEYTCIARSNLGEDRVSTFIYPAQRDDRG